MKRVDQHKGITRIMFGNHSSQSFIETNIQELFELTLKVFSQWEIEKTVRQVVTDQPAKNNKVVIQVRDGNNKQKSRAKTIYWVTAEEAEQFFMENYEKHLKS